MGAASNSLHFGASSATTSRACLAPVAEEDGFAADP